MSLYRKIHVQVWGDRRFRELSEGAQRLWFYLLTGPETTSLPGLIVAGKAALAEALGWSAERFLERFGELSAKGMAKADWDARLVWLPNAIRHHRPDNPNIVVGWRDYWDHAPECDLKAEAYRAYRSAIEPLGEGYAQAFAKGFREPFREPYAKQDQDQDQERIEERIEAPRTRRASSAASRGRSTALPPGWSPSLGLRDWARRHGLADSAVDAALGAFADHCQANARRAVDWEAAFRNWLRRERGFSADEVALADTPADELPPALPASALRERAAATPPTPPAPPQPELPRVGALDLVTAGDALAERLARLKPQEPHV
jgi:hypothetical protein